MSNFVNIGSSRREYLIVCNFKYFTIVYVSVHQHIITSREQARAGNSMENSSLHRQGGGKKKKERNFQRSELNKRSK